jgi:hypothetical protein
MVMKALLLATTFVALGTLGAPASAADSDWGRVTGLVSSPAEARRLPCQPEGLRDGAGVVCFPKRSDSWTLEYEGPCYMKVDATTLYQPWGRCVLAFADGDVVRVWGYRGTFDMYFEIVWH